MEGNTHQPIELNNHLRVIKTYLKARYRGIGLIKSAEKSSHDNNLKSLVRKWVTRQSRSGIRYLPNLETRLYAEGMLYLNKYGIVACKRRKEDKVLYKYIAIMLPQLYQTQTQLFFSLLDQMGHQGID